ncbi:MAG: hypothetical protein IJO56_07150 [Oscillospiraceae bacterium]|nr:hypothetical protein [Oscillospiraceae bacterium]
MMEKHSIFSKGLILAVVLCMLLLTAGCKNDQPQETTGFTVETTEPIVLNDRPPALQVICGQDSLQGLLGTYSWTYLEKDGTATVANASGAHPLDSKSMLTAYTTSAANGRLEFGDQPEHISVRCWSDDNFGQSAAPAETVTMNGYTAELKPGGYIYEIAAQWEDDGGDGYGLGYYCVYIICGN